MDWEVLWLRSCPSVDPKPVALDAKTPLLGHGNIWSGLADEPSVRGGRSRGWNKALVPIAAQTSGRAAADAVYADAPRNSFTETARCVFVFWSQKISSRVSNLALKLKHHDENCEIRLLWLSPRVHAYLVTRS